MKTKLFDGDYKLTSPYGWRTRGGQKEFHNGVDFSMPIGTKLKAPFSGIIEVTSDFDNNAKGIRPAYYIRVKFKNGTTGYYFHLNGFIANKGQQVQEGDYIAHSGNTGDSTGPHLHFGIKDKDGKYIDPLPFIILPNKIWQN